MQKNRCFRSISEHHTPIALFTHITLPHVQRSGLGSIQDMADKRRCVEIALREFPKLSSRAIADMCGVGDQLVRSLAETSQLRESRSSEKLVGKDGKERPATQPKRVPEPEPEPEPIYECDEFEGLDKARQPMGYSSQDEQANTYHDDGRPAGGTQGF